MLTNHQQHCHAAGARGREIVRRQQSFGVMYSLRRTICADGMHVSVPRTFCWHAAPQPPRKPEFKPPPSAKPYSTQVCALQQSLTCNCHILQPVGPAAMYALVFAQRLVACVSAVTTSCCCSAQSCCLYTACFFCCREHLGSHKQHLQAKGPQQVLLLDSLAQHHQQQQQREQVC